MSNGEDKLPPNSPQSERGVLGCIMLDPKEALWSATEALGPDGAPFYDLRNRAIYQAVIRLDRQNKPIDLITLAEELRNAGIEGGVAYLAGLPDEVPSAANIGYYTEIVREKYVLRQVLASCTEGAARAADETAPADSILAEQEARIVQIRDGASAKSAVKDARESTQLWQEDLERRIALRGKLSGLATGFGLLDRATDGLQLGEQTIIGARPSQGKTAIGLNVVERVCLQDQQPTLIISLEMSIPALLRRMASSWCRIPMNAMRRGDFSEEQASNLTQFRMAVNRSPLYMVEAVSGLNTTQLSAIILRLSKKYGLRLVVIDYLQKILASRMQEKRTYEVAEVSGVLKGLAVRTRAAFLTLAQLNRESVKDKGRQPRLSDLADSGQIERDGDTIMLLERRRTEKDQIGRQAALIIAKQRDGELGTIPLEFEGMYCRFQNPLGQASAEQSTQDQEPS